MIRLVVTSLVAAAVLLGGCVGRQAGESTVAAEPPSTVAKHTNRLARETSPYLLLHAHNPVDWYPWGEEALAKARRENKPIFLSIGYSSCHWCHVMERETFMDDEIAQLLNKHFVCIKVDREERPDIDAIYMTALRVYYQLTGNPSGGGWPLSMFLTPDGKPFFGGSYFPARDGDRPPLPGFLTIVRRVVEAWQERPDAIRRDAETIARLTKNELEGGRAVALVPLDDSLLRQALRQLREQFDPQYGGFGYDAHDPQRPKFPEPSNLWLLLDVARRTGDQQARNMLVVTLERMARGGIRDHLGGGFHRYSVDRYWRVPHFEKMLYDNAQLASVYARAYELTGRDDFRRVAEEIVQFVLRDMRSPGGAFYSAIDSQSEGEEGKYYRWRPDQVQKLLEPDEYRLFASVYGLDGPPNFEQRDYVLQITKPLAQLADEQGMTERQLESRLEPIRRKLLAARSKRLAPAVDTKILTNWNGLMIRGLADAGRILKEPEYIEAAERAARFVLERSVDDAGRLMHSYAGGQARYRGYLDDYAFFVDGLIALGQATGERRWFELAQQWTDRQIEQFWDEPRGGFYFTADDHETLLARAKDPVDGAEPAGNSVAAHNLVVLGQLLDRRDYLEKAEATIRSAQFLLGQSPAASPRLLVALAQLLEARSQADDKPADPPQ